MSKSGSVRPDYIYSRFSTAKQKCPVVLPRGHHEPRRWPHEAANSSDHGFESVLGNFDISNGFGVDRMRSGHEKCVLESDVAIVIADTDSNFDRNFGATQI